MNPHSEYSWRPARIPYSSSYADAEIAIANYIRSRNDIAEGVEILRALGETYYIDMRGAILAWVVGPRVDGSWVATLGLGEPVTFADETSARTYVEVMV